MIARRGNRLEVGLKEARTLIVLVGGLLLFGCDTQSPSTESTALHGTLERNRYDLVASANEPIVGIDVVPGQLVQAGTVLLRLDARRLGARLDAAKATVRRHEARVQELQRGGRAERLRESLAQVDVFRAELSQRQLEAQRLTELVRSNISSQSELDLALSRVEAAEARLDASLATHRELQVGATREELDQAGADLEAARENVADLQVDLDRMTVRTPVLAMIETIPYAVGELPGAGSTVAILVAEGPPWARIYVAEDRLSSIKVGSPVRVEVDGESASMPGCVRFISREAAFTPYYSLTDHDRHHLAFVTEVDLLGPRALTLPTGIPVRVSIEESTDSPDSQPCSQPMGLPVPQSP